MGEAPRRRVPFLGSGVGWGGARRGRRCEQAGGRSSRPVPHPGCGRAGRKRVKVECKVSLSAFSSEQPQPAVGYNAELQFVGAPEPKGLKQATPSPHPAASFTSPAGQPWAAAITCSKCWWWGTPRWARRRSCSDTPRTASANTTSPRWEVRRRREGGVDPRGWGAGGSVALFLGSGSRCLGSWREDLPGV